MRAAAFTLPDFPVCGPTGARDNVDRLSCVLTVLLPAGQVAVLDVRHDGGCSCASDERPSTECICTTVDVTIHTAVDPKRRAQAEAALELLDTAGA